MLLGLVTLQCYMALTFCIISWLCFFAMLHGKIVNKKATSNPQIPYYLSTVILPSLYNDTIELFALFLLSRKIEVVADVFELSKYSLLLLYIMSYRATNAKNINNINNINDMVFRSDCIYIIVR